MSNLYAVRPPTPSELPGLFDEWGESFRKSRWAGNLPNNIYWPAHLEAFQQLLNRGARVLVCCSADYPSVKLGWLVFETTARGERVAHYVYTAPLYRRQGIANFLLAEAGLTKDCVFTFRTEQARFWPKARHVPGIARRKDA